MLLCPLVLYKKTQDNMACHEELWYNLVVKFLIIHAMDEISFINQYQLLRLRRDVLLACRHSLFERPQMGQKMWYPTEALGVRRPWSG